MIRRFLAGSGAALPRVLSRLTSELASLTERATVLEVELAERAGDLAGVEDARIAAEVQRLELEGRLVELDAEHAAALDAVAALRRELEDGGSSSPADS